MTWAFLHDAAGPPPALIAYVEDRDLWRFAYGDKTKQFAAALQTYPLEFAQWDALARDPERVVAEGVPILRGQAKIVAELCQHASQEFIGGFRVPTCNVPGQY